MKRQSALSFGAAPVSSSRQTSFWWSDPERLVHRVLMLAQDDDRIRKALLAGLKRKRGNPGKYTHATKMMIIDAVKYVRATTPKDQRPVGFSAFAAALKYLPNNFTEDGVRGIYEKHRKS